jgi:hypothetical protein
VTKTIAEKARDEAERTEAELGTEEPAAEPTEPAAPTEPTPEEEEEIETNEPETVPQEENPEALKRGFDRAIKAFHDKLCKLFDVGELVPVSTPGAVGFLLPGTYEQKAHDDFQRCTTCNGHGTVLTGSFHVGDETATCPDRRCAGRGYWTKGGTQAVQAVTDPAAQAVATAQAQASQTPNGEWEDAPAWMGDPRIAPAAQ